MVMVRSPSPPLRRDCERAVGWGSARQRVYSLLAGVLALTMTAFGESRYETVRGEVEALLSFLESYDAEGRRRAGGRRESRAEVRGTSRAAAPAPARPRGQCRGDGCSWRCRVDGAVDQPAHRVWLTQVKWRQQVMGQMGCVTQLGQPATPRFDVHCIDMYTPGRRAGKLHGDGREALLSLSLS